MTTAARPRTAPRVTVVKPSLPSLWVDTSVLIKLTKVRLGEKISELDATRVSELDRLVTTLVEAGKLLCLESHQHDEFSGRRRERDILDAFASLSLGISLRPYFETVDAQMYAFMQAYLIGRDQVELGVEAFFSGDPVEALAEARRSPWMITVHFDQPKPLLEQREVGKRQTYTEMERIRQRCNSESVTYEAQLQAEHRGYGRGARFNLLRYLDAVTAGNVTIWDQAAALPFLAQLDMWKGLGGSPEEFWTFLDSEFRTAMPVSKIQTQLNAYLMTGNEKIQTGDSDDVHHLSLVVPVTTFVITDAAMERRVKELGIDVEWGAEVFSLRTIDALFSRLRAL